MLRNTLTGTTALALGAIAIMLLPTLPLKILADPVAWEPPARAAAAAGILDSIPDGASVETDVGLMSYLIDDHAVYWIGNANPVPDCILIDRVAGGTPDEWGDAAAVAERLHPDAVFAPVASQSDYELVCRPAADEAGTSG